LPGILAHHLPSLISSTVWAIHSRRSGPLDQQGKHRTDGWPILGVGPAGMGADRALIVLRRDHRIARFAPRYRLDAMDAARRFG